MRTVFRKPLSVCAVLGVLAAAGAGMSGCGAGNEAAKVCATRQDHVRQNAQECDGHSPGVVWLYVPANDTVPAVGRPVMSGSTKAPGGGSATPDDSSTGKASSAASSSSSDDNGGGSSSDEGGGGSSSDGGGDGGGGDAGGGGGGGGE